MRNSATIVYIIDDDPDICRSLTMLLCAEDFDARSFPSAECFVANQAKLPPGILLTDIRMPGMSGVELLGELAILGRMDPVIVMTGHADVTLAIQALKAGAADFIEKPFAPDVVVSAIRHCASSDHSVARQLLTSLTRREMDVFVHLVDGSTNKRIALELGISPRTVEIYRAKLMEKLNVSSLSRLVRIGFEARLPHEPLSREVAIQRQV